MASYRELIAWQKAMVLAERVYDITRSFPADERFGLTNQLRRASVSVASNIAEGHGRQSKADFTRFLRIALGSVREIETQLILAERLEMADQGQLKNIIQDAEEVARLIFGLIRC